MAKVKVWNDNIYDHHEKFKGDPIVIPAKGFIEMEWDDACQFKGQFTPLAPKDCAESERAKFYKMIRAESPDIIEASPNDALRCHADGTIAASTQELAAKILQFAGLQVKDDEAEKAAAARVGNSAEIDSLKAQVAELRELLTGQTQKRGPGRPKKAEAG